jgi:hypothetical protein
MIEMIKVVNVVNPTLDDYMDRVCSMSRQYQGESANWFELTPEMITDEDDRDEFDFIRMALWDKLIEKEFFASTETITNPTLVEVCDSVEPGNSPGSTLWGGDVWELTNTQSSLLAC